MALYSKQGNAMRLVAVDAVARSRSLRPGMALADAQALCPEILSREIDTGLTQAAFDALADAHAYVSPLVAIAPWQGPYGDLMIDITGVAHLWGGEDRLRDAVLARLARNGIAAQAAIAPSIGAAWACARFAPGAILADEAEAETALAALPIKALRLPAEAVEGLRQMGLKTIGQLYGRNRGALAARFSQAVTMRLDQALGRLEERIVPRLPVPDITAERRFPEPLGYLDDIAMVARDLATTLCARLERLGQGAQAFHLRLFRVDHRMTTLSVNAARATRDPGHIARLFANRMERLREEFDAGFGIDIVHLGATLLSDLDMAQHSAFAAADGTHDLDKLFDRLSSRLGPRAVSRMAVHETHIPERAVTLEPISASSSSEPSPSPALPRPIRLFPAPEEIEVVAELPQGPPQRMVWRRLTFSFVKASGPERIATEWWQPGAGALTRDYYVAEDPDGRRFWLFRDGLYGETASARWFIHGVFA